MSLRMPQNLSTSPRFETGLSVLEAEIAQERAAALGRLGRDVEKTLTSLGEVKLGSPGRAALVDAAAHAVWTFFVQREVCGMLDHDRVVAHYAIPPEVLARVGAR